MRRRVPLTPAQRTLLQQLSEAATRARREFDIAFSAVVFGAGLERADPVGLDGDDLVVELPDPAPSEPEEVAG